MSTFAIVSLVLLLFAIRFIVLVLKTYASTRATYRRQKAARILICIGSGGHTTEMLNLLAALDFRKKYRPRFYVLAESDTTSESKIHSLETSKLSERNAYKILRIPRSREVHQSWTSTVFTTIRSLLKSVRVVTGLRPDLIVCNGPGSTSVPIALVGFAHKLFFVNTAVKIVFVESVCRVRTLSMTGKILYFFSDYFIVQWPLLKLKFKKAIYLGTFF